MKSQGLICSPIGEVNPDLPSVQPINQNARSHSALEKTDMDYFAGSTSHQPDVELSGRYCCIPLLFLFLYSEPRARGLGVSESWDTRCSQNWVQYGFDGLPLTGEVVIANQASTEQLLNASFIFHVKGLLGF